MDLSNAFPRGRGDQENFLNDVKEVVELFLRVGESLWHDELIG
jgi:hypothetical protein